MASEIKGQAKVKKPWHGQRKTVCSYCGGDLGDSFFFNLNSPIEKPFICITCNRKAK